MQPATCGNALVGRYKPGFFVPLQAPLGYPYILPPQHHGPSLSVTSLRCHAILACQEGLYMAKGETNTAKKKRDNLEAARTVRDALQGFTSEEQQLILKWAAESLGIGPVASAPAPRLERPEPLPSAPTVPSATSRPAEPTSAKDVKTFVDEKNPQTDIHLAATIAYFYRFEAPEAERREDIDAAFLRDALRLAGRPGQLVNPRQTLNNAHAKGILDRNARGRFSINSVGENLVGMTLPMKSTGKKAPKAK